MTNIEKYRVLLNEMHNATIPEEGSIDDDAFFIECVKIAKKRFSVDRNGIIGRCDDDECQNCIFYDEDGSIYSSCTKRIFRWLCTDESIKEPFISNAEVYKNQIASAINRPNSIDLPAELFTEKNHMSFGMTYDEFFPCRVYDNPKCVECRFLSRIDDSDEEEELEDICTFKAYKWLMDAYGELGEKNEFIPALLEELYG